MSNKLESYFLAQAKKNTAYEKYNYACAALELALIKERLAEVYSQVEPLSKIDESFPPGRERLAAAAYYVVHGHLPLQVKE